MPSSDVLIDVGWTLERDDLESILHVDRARHDVITSAFDGKGPLRVVTKASLACCRIRCSSLGDVRVLEDAAQLWPYLRNAHIKILEIECSLLDAESTQILTDLKEYFVVDILQLSGNAFDLIDGALDCRTLTLLSRFYARGASEAKEGYGRYKDFDENKIEEFEERFAYLEDFFKLRTVRNAETIHLLAIPYIHGKAVSRWLHGDDAVPHVKRAKELYIWWECDQRDEVNALISVLEQASRFRSDAEPREYKFFVRSCPSSILSRKQENDVGEVLEVEAMHTHASSVSVTRHPAETAKRTTLVQNMDGPKVWEFRTARELAKYLVGNSVYELLARSGLIANEIICKCGLPMHVQTWCCSGDCENGHNRPFQLNPTFHSWFWDFDERRIERGTPVETILKLVILHLCDDRNADETTEVDNHRNKLIELHKELLKHEDNTIEEPLERFYTAVTRKYPYDGAFVLLVLEYWEYNPIPLFG